MALTMKPSKTCHIIYVTNRDECEDSEKYYLKFINAN
uniref:Uncharacterized protein n=1 Tax=Anguilla anguilla TaxID=7936 RepID=A0A0E9RLK6_ANGAN